MEAQTQRIRTSPCFLLTKSQRGKQRGQLNFTYGVISKLKTKRNSKPSQQQGTKQDAPSLHSAAPTASAAAQPSTPLRGDGKGEERLEKTQTPGSLAQQAAWQSKGSWGGCARSSGAPRRPSSVVELPEALPGPLRAHCPSRRAGAGRRISFPSQPPSFKSVATAGEEGRRGALALFVLLNPTL